MCVCVCTRREEERLGVAVFLSSELVDGELENEDACVTWLV